MMCSFPSAFARVACVLPVMTLAVWSHAQAVPAVVTPPISEAFQLPTVGGTLRYSLTGSESLLFGYDGLPGTGLNALTDVSGDLAYLSKSERNPFSAVYSGGYLFGTSNEPSYAFQNLALSQVARTRNWTFTVSDAVSYLPQTPDIGLSGIPGVGDVSVSPVPTTVDGGLGILTEYGTRVTNSLSGTASRTLTASTSISGTGIYDIQRFISSGSDGINNDQVTAGVNITHRINALSSFGGGYNYANSSFSGITLLQNLSYNTQTLSINYNRQVTREFSFTVGGGPQRTSGSGNAAVTAPSTDLAVNAGALYGGRTYSSSLSYVRGTFNGTGVVVGSRSDAVSFGVSRPFARVWNASGTVGFNHSTALPNSLFPPFSSDAEVASAQVSRRFIPVLSGFASYSLQRQSFTGASTGISAFNGLSQIISFGVTYSPAPLLGRR